MKRIYSTILALLSLVVTTRAEEFLDMASLVSKQGTNAIFESTGKGEKTKDIEANAQKSVFHQLFYKGIDGINDVARGAPHPADDGCYPVNSGQ